MYENNHCSWGDRSSCEDCRCIILHPIKWAFTSRTKKKKRTTKDKQRAEEKKRQKQQTRDNKTIRKESLAYFWYSVCVCIWLLRVPCEIPNCYQKCWLILSTGQLSIFTSQSAESDWSSSSLLKKTLSALGLTSLTDQPSLTDQRALIHSTPTSVSVLHAQKT